MMLFRFRRSPSRVRNAGRPLLALLLLATIAAADLGAVAQRVARRSWWHRAPVETSRYYAIKTDLPLAEARTWARHLDAIYDEYATRLASLPPREPEELQVYIFATRDDYIETMQRRFRINANGTGGMFFVVPNLGSGLAFWVESLPPQRIRHVIQHEGFHQFAYSRFGDDLPIWVNEGLAEFFGEAVPAGDAFVLGQSTPRVVETVRRAIEAERSIPFLTMVTMTHRQWNERVRTGDASLLYHQAWSMVHFLVYGHNAEYRDEFDQFLRLVNGGMLAEPAFIEVFGSNLDEFERVWKQYALAARPSSFVTAMERMEFLAEGALELSRRGGEGATAADSLDALKEQLRAIDFAHPVSRHGRETELSAKDDDNFLIPPDDLSGRGPRFVVERPRLGRLSRREQQFEEAMPRPPSIGTADLEPRGVSVRWIRDRKTGDLSYRLLVR
jgi:hypothetical protein